LDCPETFRVADHRDDFYYQAVRELYPLDEQIRVDWELGSRETIPVRMVMYSNYDSMGSAWLEQGIYAYEESYWGDVMDALNLNPAKMKEALKKHGLEAEGEYPDMPERDKHEYADYDEIIVEHVNTTTGGNMLTLLMTVPVKEYLDNPGKVPQKILIPKGTTCFFYSSFYGGGGAMDARTVRDMEVKIGDSGSEYPYFYISDDGGSYGPKACYGCGNDIFDVEYKVLEWRKNESND
ncbi:MAG: hypothetical protein Q8M92_10505, partial [Candidatus Subteraquimicrobiales bacterium]|nr:hypothetical protein [Candidatus Subteraquimicrobiales bacterium]